MVRPKKSRKQSGRRRSTRGPCLGFRPSFSPLTIHPFLSAGSLFFVSLARDSSPPTPPPSRVSRFPPWPINPFFFFERGVLPRFLFRARALLRLFAFHSRESDCVYSFHQRLLRSEEDFKDLWFAAGVPKTNKASSWWQNENGFKNTQKTKRRRHKPQNKLSGPFQPRTWRAKEREKIKIREP